MTSKRGKNKEVGYEPQAASATNITTFLTSPVRCTTTTKLEFVVLWIDSGYVFSDTKLQMVSSILLEFENYYANYDILNEKKNAPIK